LWGLGLGGLWGRLGLELSGIWGGGGGGVEKEKPCVYYKTDDPNLKGGDKTDGQPFFVWCEDCLWKFHSATNPLILTFQGGSDGSSPDVASVFAETHR
jgi:hypothetical protein